MSIQPFRSLMPVLAAAALTLGCTAVSHQRVDLAALDGATIQQSADRAAVLNVVRQHRRRASEAWCKTLADAVYEEAVAAAVDPLLVASIVARESSFKSRIVSRKGAVGLMQLRPWVARDVAARSELEWNGLETLHSPELNVRLGITYFKELMQRFDGDERMALTAYNYGPTRVSRQVRRGTYAGSSYADRIVSLYEDLRRNRA